MNPPISEKDYKHLREVAKRLRSYNTYYDLMKEDDIFFKALGIWTEN